MARHSASLWRTWRALVLATGIMATWPLIPISTSSMAQSKSASSWTSSVVPRAQCGPGERGESGLQGQTTLAERFSSQGSQAYNCNLELGVGEGGAWSMTASDDCAYFSSAPGTEGRQYPGVAVVDASDRRNPRGVVSLKTPAMLTPNETVEAHAGRKLLAGIQTSFGVAPLPDSAAAAFEVYDIANCRQPALKATLSTPPDMVWHAAHFAPDGRTYYATSWGSKPSEQDGFVAIDVSDPAKPREVLRWKAPQPDLGPHWLAISTDGRMYVGVAGNPQFGRRNGIAILDISDIQARRPDPKVSVLRTLYWEEGSIGQIPMPLRINGKPYVICMD